MLAAVASQAAIAIQNAQMHESSAANASGSNRDLKLAEQVQKRFLPQSVPEIPGFEFFAHYDPAYEVGGDYYDFVPLPGDRLAIALGDVSGKGVAAALMMAKFSGDTRYCILTENSPGRRRRSSSTPCSSRPASKRSSSPSVPVRPRHRETHPGDRFGGPPARHDPPRQRHGRRGRRGNRRVSRWASSPRSITSKPRSASIPATSSPSFPTACTDARNLREELYDSRDKRRVMKKLAETSGGPEAVGRALLQDIREYSAGHDPGRRHHADLLRTARLADTAA